MSASGPSGPLVLGARIKISILSVDIKHPNICYFPFNWSLEHKIKWTLDGSMPHFYLYRLRNKPGVLMMKNGQLIIFTQHQLGLE